MSQRRLSRATTAVLSATALAIAAVGVSLYTPEQAQAASVSYAAPKFPLAVPAGATFTRIAGPDRYTTAVAVSKHAHPDGSVHAVYIASGRNFPDALAAAPAARAKNAPILLTDPDHLPEAVATEVRRLNPQSIFIVGGPGAVSHGVEHALEGLIPAQQVSRIAGQNRFETAANISRASFNPGVGTVFIVVGTNFPDALSASPIAARSAAPILSTASHYLPGATIAELNRLRPANAVIVGGAGVISPGVANHVRTLTDSNSVTRIGGNDRYHTSALLSRAFTPANASTVFLATGQNFPDALAAGPVAAASNAPVLLTMSSRMQPATIEEMSRLHPDHVNVVGSTGVVSEWIGQEARYSAADTKRFVELVNDLRRGRGLQPVRLHTTLTMVSRDWAINLTSVGISHNPHYKSQSPGGWRTIGEVVAWSTVPTVDEMFNLWVNSPGHLEVMVHPSMNTVGFGMWRGNNSNYAVSVFAAY